MCVRETDGEREREGEEDDDRECASLWHDMTHSYKIKKASSVYFNCGKASQAGRQTAAAAVPRRLSSLCETHPSVYLYTELAAKCFSRPKLCEFFSLE